MLGIFQIILRVSVIGTPDVDLSLFLNPLSIVQKSNVFDDPAVKNRAVSLTPFKISLDYDDLLVKHRMVNETDLWNRLLETLVNRIICLELLVIGCRMLRNVSCSGVVRLLN